MNSTRFRIIFLIVFIVLAISFYMSQSKENPPSDSNETAITVLSPKSGDVLEAGQTYNVTWEPGIVADRKISLNLYYVENDSLVPDFKGFYRVENTGSRPLYIDPLIPKGKYQIRLYTNDYTPKNNNVHGQSGIFTINSKTSLPSAPVLTSISPNPVDINAKPATLVNLIGSGFAEEAPFSHGPYKVLLIDPANGKVVQELQLVLSATNNKMSAWLQQGVKPGVYMIVVEDLAWGQKSKPYPLTII